MTTQTTTAAPAESCDQPSDRTEQTGESQETAAPPDSDASTPRQHDADTVGLSRLRVRVSLPPHRVALIFGLVALTAVAGVCGWLGITNHRLDVEDQRYAMYLQTGRQGALNLTTVDWQHADTDVARILDLATGPFRDEFSARAQDFIAVVKETQSRTEGVIVDAGIESKTATGAAVLVAINVKTIQGDQPDQRSRGWRMRIVVEGDRDSAKVANVEFVP